MHAHERCARARRFLPGRFALFRFWANLWSSEDHGVCGSPQARPNPVAGVVFRMSRWCSLEGPVLTDLRPLPILLAFWDLA